MSANTIDSILREVSQQVYSPEDLLPTTPSFHLKNAEQLELFYQEIGTHFLEKLEQLERVESVRRVCQKSAEQLGSRQKLDIDVATAHFGVGQCGEKSALAGVKMSLAGLKHIQLLCNNEPHAKEAAKKHTKDEIAQTHQFILKDASTEKIRKCAGTIDALSLLESCEGELVDAHFGFKCHPKEIRKQPAFMNYFAVHQISRVAAEMLIETTQECMREGEIRMHNAALIYKYARQLMLQEKDFPFLGGPRGDFITAKKTELVTSCLRRHFPFFNWSADLASRGASADGDNSAIWDLEKSVSKYGFTALVETTRVRRKIYATLWIKNPPIASLYALEMRSASPGWSPPITACIINYLASPFRECRMDAF